MRYDLGVVARENDVTESLLCFLAEDSRLKVPMAVKYETLNEKKEKRGKTLTYEKESKEVREGLDISRGTEWSKWKQFVAGRPIRGKELQKLLEEGHKPIPTRWVDVDRNAHLRRSGEPTILPDYKSRLCSRGDLLECGGVVCTNCIT